MGRTSTKPSAVLPPLGVLFFANRKTMNEA
jgi:hypothetical protein